MPASMLRHETKEIMDDEPITPRTKESLESLLDAFKNLNIEQEQNNPFIDFY